MLLWLLACPKGNLDPAVRTNQLLFEADAAWENRGKVGLAAAAVPLVEAFSLSPGDARVAWRLTRWQVAVGLAAPDVATARSAYGEARQRATDCLDADPGFAARRRSEGWTAALAELTPARTPCAAWGALAWARWLEVHGPAAGAMDFESIWALVASGRQAPDPYARTAVVWAEGLVLALQPTWAGQDLQGASARLREVVAQDRKSLARTADLLAVRVALGEMDQATLRAAIEAMGATTPEDQGVKARMLAPPAP